MNARVVLYAGSALITDVGLSIGSPTSVGKVFGAI